MLIMAKTAHVGKELARVFVLDMFFEAASVAS
jgi:hypothetical protein